MAKQDKKAGKNTLIYQEVWRFEDFNCPDTLTDCRHPRSINGVDGRRAVNKASYE